MHHYLASLSSALTIIFIGVVSMSASLESYAFSATITSSFSYYNKFSSPQRRHSFVSSSVALFLSSSSTSCPPLPPPRPFQLQRIDHIVLRCHDFHAMLNFYTNVLGCTIDTPRDENIGRFGGALTHLRAGDSAMIDLLSYDESQLTKEGQIAIMNQLHSGSRKGGTSTNNNTCNSNNLSDIAQFASSTSTLDHVCLRIEPFNEDEIRQYLEQSHNIQVIASGLRKGAEGVGPSLYLQDPEGNVVELKGPSSSSPLRRSPPPSVEEMTQQSRETTQQQQQNSSKQESSTDGTKDSSDGDSFPPPTSSSSPPFGMYISQEAEDVGKTVVSSSFSSSSSSSSSLSSSSSVTVSTPCTRICRYNADFYDGQVCIGCFREAYEIGTWNSMTASERSMALLDAADRHPDDDDDDDDDDDGDGDGDGDGNTLKNNSSKTFDGSISKSELMRQAKDWSRKS